MSESRKPIRKQINHAVVLQHAYSTIVARVVAIDENGACIVDLYGCGKYLHREPIANTWPVCGRYRQEYASAWDRFWGKPTWIFYPEYLEAKDP